MACQQVSYCEEHVDCRRVMIMAHFGELNFAARHCHKTCDNCQKSSEANHETRDMTQACSPTNHGTSASPERHGQSV